MTSINKHKKLRDKFPQPRQRKRSSNLAIRVTPEVKMSLEKFAAKRGQMLATLIWNCLDAVAATVDEFELQLNDVKNKHPQIQQHPQIQFWVGRLVVNGWELSSNKALTDPMSETLRGIETRLLKIFPRHIVQRYLDRPNHPELGCSIKEALEEREWPKINRMLKKLERRTKS